jgi:hypothetical protein
MTFSKKFGAAPHRLAITVIERKNSNRAAWRVFKYKKKLGQKCVYCMHMIRELETMFARGIEEEVDLLHNYHVHTFRVRKLRNE